ncbi:MAG: hypothetical protein CL607_24705 [Anaerolineaceae bacterium]|nr:hypothetical protein [Anaerolineaceae bacterium]
MHTAFSLDCDVLTVAQSHKVYVVARFKAEELVSSSRPGLNLSLVIDRSGSMAGAKIDYTRQAAQFLVQHLGPQDAFSIVLYNNTVETLLPPQYVQNKDDVMQRLEHITVSSTTNLSGGWLQGCQHVAQNLAPTLLNRVLLMTDGLANRGVTDREQLVEMARHKRDESIVTTTMGLGNDFNEELMMAIADAGGGSFYFIDSPEVTPEIFNEELRGLLNTVGQNLKITITASNKIAHIEQLNAYPTETVDDTISYILGDIYSNEIKTLVLELDVPDLEKLGERQIGMLHFAYDEIGPAYSHYQEQDLPIIINVADANDMPVARRNDITQAVLLLKAAHTRQQAVEAADQGKHSEASDMLYAMAKDISESNLNSAILHEERNALIDQAKRLAEGKSTFDAYQRKTMATQAYYTRTDRHNATVMLRTRDVMRMVQQGQDDDHDALAPSSDMPPTHLLWRDHQFPLTGNLIRIGRAIHNDIVIDAGGISRFHCQIRRDGDKLVLEDVGSTNGTYIKGQALEGPAIVQTGDDIFISQEKLSLIHRTI